jgi:lipopolysaccharide/colanic/teichoic acid biosynthesis glycosyltransferase
MLEVTKKSVGKNEKMDRQKPRQGINSFYGRYTKRLLDVALSVIALVALSWLLLIGVLLARLGVGKPVIFKQTRPGRYGKPFVMFKFHNMTEETDEDSKLLPESERITKAGRLLRATSIDELPQLVNILKGDMSIIGPRPLLMEYLPRYSKCEMRRHEARPGLYCPSLRGELFHTGEWSSQFDNDVWYVDNMSFAVDARMVWKTLCTVFSKRGNEVRSQASRQAFKAKAEAEHPHSDNGTSIMVCGDDLTHVEQQGIGIKVTERHEGTAMEPTYEAAEIR